MIRIFFGVLALALVLDGCKKSEDDNSVGPVWILYVTVRDGQFPNRELANCAHVKWKYAGEENNRDVGCRNANNFVKVWEPISEDVRVFFRVECAGFTSSEEMYADFSYSLVDTLADGQEVIHSRTVTLYPE